MKKQTTQKKQNNSKAKSIILAALSVFLLLIGFLALFAALWYVDLYGDVGFDSVIYTIFSDLGGTDPAKRQFSYSRCLISTTDLFRQYLSETI